MSTSRVQKTAKVLVFKLHFALEQYEHLWEIHAPKELIEQTLDRVSDLLDELPTS